MSALFHIKFPVFLGSALLCALTMTSSAQAVPAAPSVVELSGTQLMVQKRNSDGTLAPAAAYTIRGVTWDPATAAPATGPNPNGTGTVDYGFFFDWPGRTPQGFEVLDFWKRSQFAVYYKNDLLLMAQMNVNTVRVYGEMGTTPAQTLAVLDECYRQGIMVVFTLATAKAEMDSQAYINRVQQYKNHPAILMWALGNEWNLNHYYGYATMAEAMAATNTAAAAIKNLDPNHPVSSSLGDRFTADPISCPPDNPCCMSPAALSDVPSIVAQTPNVDLWGLNIYRGNSFKNLFNQWQSITAKPFYLGEFGVDAFDSQSFVLYGCGVATHVDGIVNQNKQYSYDLSLWQELAAHLSAHDPSRAVIGGFVHQFNDAIWKSGSYQAGLGGTVNYDGLDGIQGTADDDKSYRKYNRDGFLIVGGFPDNVSNEEYYGMVSSARVKRLVYTTLQDLYAHLPNILPNPGFERQKAQWSGTGAVDCTVSHSGACSLKFTAAGTASSTPAARVTMNRNYTISGWIKTAITTPPPTGAQGVRMRVLWYDDYGVLLLAQNLNTLLKGTADWQLISQTWTAPPQATLARVQCQVFGISTTDSAWFDDISIVPAN